MIIRRLLVIDPDPEVGKIYEERFRSQGYIVIYSNNPKMALELSRALRPDMIILDPGFKEGGGEALLGALLAAAETAHIPVIVTADGYYHDELKKLHGERVSERVSDDMEKLLIEVDSYFNSMASLISEAAVRRNEAEKAKAIFDEQIMPKRPEVKTPSPVIEAEPISEDEAAPRYKVLLVADDPFFLRVYEAKLTEAGFFAYAVPDPEMPFDFIAREAPNVLVMVDKFSPEILEHFKNSDKKPLIIDILPSDKICPKGLEEFNGFCLPQESLSPVKLINEIDQKMNPNKAVK